MSDSRRKQNLLLAENLVRKKTEII